MKKLKGNRIALLLLNRDAALEKPVTVDWADIGLLGKASVKNVYEEQELGVFEKSLTLDTRPHAAWFLLLSTQLGQ